MAIDTTQDHQVEAAGANPPPTIDVPELTRFLDGTYADARNLVRSNLAEHASVA